MGAIHHLIVGGKPFVIEGPVPFDDLRHDWENPDCDTMSDRVTQYLNPQSKTSYNNRGCFAPFVFVQHADSGTANGKKKIVAAICPQLFVSDMPPWDMIPEEHHAEIRSRPRSVPSRYSGFMAWIEPNVLGVKAELQGRGLGPALMASTIDFFTEHGADHFGGTLRKVAARKPDAVLIHAANGDKTPHAIKFYVGLNCQKVKREKDGTARMYFAITPENLAALKRRAEIRPMAHPQKRTENLPEGLPLD